MKKVLALMAVVAVVAISSVAYAATTSTVSVSATVGSTLSLSSDCNTLTGLDFGTDLSQEIEDTCTLTISANDDWDLFVDDTDDNGGSPATEDNSGSVYCAAASTCLPASDEIEGVSDGTDVTGGADGGEIGYYLTDINSGATLNACGLDSAVCNVHQDSVSANTRAIDEEAVYPNGGTITFTLDGAVDNVAPVQAAGAYEDTWTATVVID